jgi:uncharacterized protein YoxC
MYFSLYDLGMFVLFIILVITGVYLIAVLQRAFYALSQASKIMDANQDDLRKTFSMFPEVLANLNELAVILKETADQTSNAFGSLQNDVTDTVDDLRDGLQTFAAYIKVFSEAFKAVFSK